MCSRTVWPYYGLMVVVGGVLILANRRWRETIEPMGFGTTQTRSQQWVDPRAPSARTTELRRFVRMLSSWSVRYGGPVAAILILLGFAGICAATAIPRYSCEPPLALQIVREEGPRCIVVQSEGTPGSVPPDSNLALKIALSLLCTTLVAVAAFRFGRIRDSKQPSDSR
jgi:hypothetical protein